MNRQPEMHAITANALPVGAGLDEPVDTAPALDLAATLRQVWSAIYRNWLLIAAIVGACVLLGVVATMLATPKYLATASLQIDQESSKVLGTEDAQPADAYQDADRFLQTQVDVLSSRLVAEQVANSLALAADDRFLLAMHARPQPTSAGKPMDRHEQVMKLLADNLVINLPRNSRVVDIGFRSPDPALAQRVANSFATNFIMLNIKRKFDTTAYARSFLQDQLVSAKQRLEDSERAMLAYSRAVGLIDASAGIGTSDTGGVTTGPRSLVTSDLVSLNNAFASAQANRVVAQQHWENAARTPLLSLPEVLANITYGSLVQARSTAQAAYDQDSQRHRADFPALQQLGAQIVSYDRQITRLAGAIRDSIRDQYLIAKRQEDALSGSVEQLKAATLSEQDKSVRYNILKRETDTNRTMYDGLLQRYKELSAQAGVSSNNVSMVDTADLPTRPVSPKPLLNLVAAALLGLILAAAVVLVREKFDDAVRSPDDVPAKLGLPLLNTVPLLKADQTPREVLDDPRSPLSESYAALRTQLELAGTDGLPGTLLFTSSRPGEGKSTSAYAVARDFARIGKRVVLIDSDLRRPSLHRLFGLLNRNGFTSVLARHRALDEVLQPTGIPRLAFLSTGPLPPNPAELLSGPSLKIVLAELRQKFDLIVIDSPPVLGLADAVILASNADGVVFVTEANASHHGQAKAALRRLRAAQAPILGAVLTKYDARKVGYGYDYGYYAYSYGNAAADQDDR